MKTPEDFVKEMSEEDLKQSFFDYETYRKTGIIRKESPIRQVRDAYASYLYQEGLSPESYDIGCTATAFLVLYEIARRAYTLWEVSRV